MDLYPTLAVPDNGPYAPLVVRYVASGTAEHSRLAGNSASALVEFYDPRSTATVHGTRICAFAVDQVSASRAGLHLHMGVPEWALSAAARERVVEWVANLSRVDRHLCGDDDAG